MKHTPALAADALFGMLIPLWQIVIGILVLVAVVVAIHKMFVRGPSRMGGAMLLSGGAVVCITVLVVLTQML